MVELLGQLALRTVLQADQVVVLVATKVDLHLWVVLVRLGRVMLAVKRLLAFICQPQVVVVLAQLALMARVVQAQGAQVAQGLALQLTALQHLELVVAVAVNTMGHGALGALVVVVAEARLE